MYNRYKQNPEKLQNFASKLIPGVSQLFGKRPDLYLPGGKWPTYYSKAKGITVWGIDNKKYYDFTMVGIGTSTLGYSDTDINKAAIKSIKSSTMNTLNPPEDVELAELLLKLHPWAENVRYCRTGGETMSVAIRIARASTKKDKILFCGYHGWHDWYLSANLSDDKSLDGHLLPGLKPKGVPRNLKNTVFPFNYNQIDELEKIVKEHEIGVIKMEVVRSMEPTNDFLYKVRQLANSKNIILVFDECTTGFRETFGGIHKKYNIEPDMAMFGKALGNGYAITSVIGKSKIMQEAQSTFISSTFWTERIGSSAALKTLEIMEREKSWEKITNIGNKISEIWKKLAQRYELPISIFGIPALIKFRFNSKLNLEYKTLITQEMLKKGYLAANSVYVCTQHNDEILNGYENSLEKVFKLIAECEQGRSIYKLLDGSVCSNEFQRLS